jgi:hypothetical protein
MRREGREGEAEGGEGRGEGGGGGREGGMDLDDAAKNDETWYPNEP